MEEKKAVICIIEDMDFPNLTSFADFVRAYNPYHLSDYLVFGEYYYWRDNVFVVVSCLPNEERDFYEALRQCGFDQLISTEILDMEKINWKWKISIDGDGRYVFSEEKDSFRYSEYYMLYDENTVKMIPEQLY